MADPYIYNQAQIIIGAVRLASNADIQSLSQLILQQSRNLKLELVFRILLTFLPESTDPALYVDFLHSLSAVLPSGIINAHLPTLNIPDQQLSEDDAVHRVQKLRLLPLADPALSFETSVDAFTTFLLHRAHRIDSETGSLPLVAQLLAPFVEHSQYLRTWMISTLCPLLRLDYEYYPHHAPAYTLNEFEKLEGAPAIDSLLSEAAQNRDGDAKPEAGRDLRGLVGPWMYGENGRKRRKLDSRQRRKSSVAAVLYGAVGELDEHDTTDHAPNGWAHVNHWLLQLAVRDFPQAVDAIVQWDGPNDVDYGDWGNELPQVEQEVLQSATNQYAQAALATIYTTGSSSAKTLDGSQTILARVAQLMDLRSPPPLEFPDIATNDEISQDYLGTLSETHLLYDSPLGNQNPLTCPSQPSLSFTYLLLASAYKLERFGHPKTCKSVAELVISGKQNDQMADLRKALYRLQTKARDEKAWDAIRGQILWLWDWGWQPNAQNSEEPRGLYCKIKRVDLEIEVLKAFLNASCETFNLLSYEGSHLQALCVLIIAYRLQACSRHLLQTASITTICGSLGKHYNKLGTVIL